MDGVRSESAVVSVVGEETGFGDILVEVPSSSGAGSAGGGSGSEGDIGAGVDEEVDDEREGAFVVNVRAGGDGGGEGGLEDGVSGGVSEGEGDGEVVGMVALECEELAERGGGSGGGGVVDGARGLVVGGRVSGLVACAAFGDGRGAGGGAVFGGAFSDRGEDGADIAGLCGFGEDAGFALSAGAVGGSDGGVALAVGVEVSVDAPLFDIVVGGGGPGGEGLCGGADLEFGLRRGGRDNPRNDERNDGDTAAEPPGEKGGNLSPKFHKGDCSTNGGIFCNFFPPRWGRNNLKQLLSSRPPLAREVADIAVGDSSMTVFFSRWNCVIIFLPEEFSPNRKGESVMALPMRKEEPEHFVLPPAPSHAEMCARADAMRKKLGRPLRTKIEGRPLTDGEIEEVCVALAERNEWIPAGKVLEELRAEGVLSPKRQQD